MDDDDHESSPADQDVPDNVRKVEKGERRGCGVVMHLDRSEEKYDILTFFSFSPVLSCAYGIIAHKVRVSLTWLQEIIRDGKHSTRQQVHLTHSGTRQIQDHGLDRRTPESGTTTTNTPAVATTAAATTTTTTSNPSEAPIK